MTDYEKHIARVFLCLGMTLGAVFVFFLPMAIGVFLR